MKKYIEKLVVPVILILLISGGCRREEMVLPEDNLPPEETQLDIQPPSVIIQSPSTEFSVALTNERVNISGVANDNEELLGISYTSSAKSGEVNGVENWLIPDFPLKMGDNKITVTAKDKSLNTSYDEIIITRNRYLTFLSQPFASPSDFFTNTPQRLRINISIAPVENLIEGSVKLVELDESNEIVKELATLYDDGDLNHGDDIKGDWVYSTHTDFLEADSREIRMRVIAQTDETSGTELALSAICKVGVYDKLGGGDYDEVNSVYESLNSELESLLRENDLEESLTKTFEYLIENERVSSARIKNNGIEMTFKNGLKGSLMIFKKNGEGEMVIKGGLDDEDRKKQVTIPVSSQTRGIKYTGLKAGSYTDIITNKKILIWAPYEDEFSIDMSPSILNILNNSKINFNVTSLENDECTVTSLNDLTDYGLLVFDSHGSEGRELGTGEEMTESNFEEYSILLKSGQIGMWNSVILNDENEIEATLRTYCIRDEYISSLSGNFPNSIIYNGSCESTMNPDFKDAFIEKGAKSYFGFDKVVNTRFCSEEADEIIEGLVIDLDQLSDIFITGQKDPVDPYAELELFGNDAMHYTLTLLNGDFEAGSLLGWNVEGDGRVISKLGNEDANKGNYMGIISTGLGYTTSTGQISQQFYIPDDHEFLQFKWNFFSEEFIEWVGSQYQDFIKIAILDENGIEHILLNKNIDQFNNEFELVNVSPTIVFDQGDVFSTSWQTGIFDLSPYKDQNVTLVISAGDVGDSMYDSALLLDEILTY